MLLYFNFGHSQEKPILEIIYESFAVKTILNFIFVFRQVVKPSAA